MKRRIVAFTLIMIAILLTGCWDSSEIEDMFLVWGMGWDVPEEDPDKDLITISLVAPSTEEGAEEPISVIASTGHSIEQARMNAQARVYRSIRMGHLRILIVGEELAKKGIQTNLDSIGRNPRIGRETLIAVYNGKVTDIWEELEHPNNPNKVQYLVQLINTNSKFTRAVKVTFRDFFESLSQEGVEPITAYLKLDEAKEMANAFAVAVFKEDKMVGILEDLEVQMLQIIRNEYQDGTITIGSVKDQEEDATTFAIRRGGTKVETTVKDGRPHALLNIELEGDIIEYSSVDPLDSVENIRKAEKNFETRIRREIHKVIDKVQTEYQSDIFGFGRYFRAYHYAYWKDVNWEDEFPELEVDVKIKVNVRRIGIES